MQLYTSIKRIESTLPWALASEDPDPNPNPNPNLVSSIIFWDKKTTWHNNNTLDGAPKIRWAPF